MLRFEFEWLPYIIQSIFLTIFVYLIVKKVVLPTKQFKLARYFLIFGVVTAHLFPFLVFSLGYERVSLTPDLIRPLIRRNASVDTSLGWVDFLIIAYVVVSLYLLARLIFNIVFSINSIKKGERAPNDSQVYIHPEAVSPYSFLSYICLPLGYNSMHLAHEMMHVKQRHTIDILIVEGLKCLFWYNIVLNYCANLMKEIHEYQVDDALIRLQHTDKIPYCTLIVQTFEIAYQSKIIHTFHSLIKNRITMINQNPEQRKPLALYGSIASFAFLSFFLSLERQTMTPVNTDEITMSSDSIPDRGVEYYIQKYGMNKITSVDTIIDFNYDTYVEKVTIVKNEVPEGPYMYIQFLYNQVPMDQKKIKEIQEKYYK